MQDWYKQVRKEFAESFATAVRVDDKVETLMSPSGNYSLEMISYSNGPGKWEYSQGLIRNYKTGDVIADVKRNFRHFPYSWCEGHPSGHDYLICGEDYQGQTIVELDTGKRVDHISDDAESGGGFCWTAHYPSPDGKFIFVDGCIWAAEYELIQFDFSKPLELPYQELKRWPVNEVQGFQPDGSFVFVYTIEIRLSDGKPIDDLTDEEWDEYKLSFNDKNLYGTKTFQVKQNPDGTEEEVILKS